MHLSARLWKEIQSMKFRNGNPKFLIFIYYATRQIDYDKAKQTFGQQYFDP